jgi:hypothetical protein
MMSTFLHRRFFDRHLGPEGLGEDVIAFLSQGDADG